MPSLEIIIFIATMISIYLCMIFQYKHGRNKKIIKIVFVFSIAITGVLHIINWGIELELIQNMATNNKNYISLGGLLFLVILPLGAFIPYFDKNISK